MDIPNTSATYLYDDNLLNQNHGGGSNSDINFTNEDEELINHILLKTNKQGLNRGWNDKNELLIVSVGENAASYKYMHEKSAMICTTIHNTFKIILIVCSSLLSVMTSLPDTYTCTYEGFMIVRYTFTYLVTLFSVLLHFLQYSYLSERHSRAAGEFNIIYHDIQQQMCLYRRDRYIAFRYISKIMKKYDSLVMSSPDINKYVLNEFKKKFVDANINISDIAKKLQKIDIINEDDNNNNNSRHNTNSISENTNTDNTGINGINGINMSVINRNKDVSLNNTTFVITGDITDNDLNNCEGRHLKELRSRFFKENSTYEYFRFLQNEND